MASTMHVDPPKPKVIVALDFGTTFSGFAFAHTSDPAKVYGYFDYPRSGREKPYCKTLTASYYKAQPGARGAWRLKSWGYPARAEYERDVQAVRKHRLKRPPSNKSDPPPTVGHYLTRFKLHLASRDIGTLPVGLTVEVVIADYLHEMGGVILTHLQHKFGAHMTKEVIQWCITVPSIWDDSAKATMKSCMAAAGLVSPHPLIVVLEPEAASFHCHKTMSEQILEVGDKLLVADIGGGTSDIVVQEVVSVGELSETPSSSYRVREVTTSLGGLCGGTYVDSRFMEFLHRQIGPCLQDCVLTHPHVYAQLIKAWESAKTNFGDPTTSGEGTDIDLPNSLASQWETYDRSTGATARESYDALEISDHELRSIFDPVVDQILDLIGNQWVQSGGQIKVLVVVGGFAASPYLLDRIRRRFSRQVRHIFSPPNPGSAVCQGAAALAFHPNTVVSRICKRTYGFAVRELFQPGIDPIEFWTTDGDRDECRHRFRVLVRKGDEVRLDDCISTMCNACSRSNKTTLRLFSSSESDPRYTIGESVTEEGEFCVMDVSADLTQLSRPRNLKVSLFFGGSSIEVKAEAVNFVANVEQSLPIHVDYLLNRS